jgi:hypothetical protein
MLKNICVEGWPEIRQSGNRELPGMQEDISPSPPSLPFALIDVYQSEISAGLKFERWQDSMIADKGNEQNSNLNDAEIQGLEAYVTIGLHPIDIDFTVTQNRDSRTIFN